MHYYIDGYNLMFRIVRAADDLQSQRQKIIRDLNEKIKLLDLDVTIVFDSQYQIGDSSRSHLNVMEIRFSAHGETADEHILKELKKASNTREETVVTSDKKLAWLSRRKGAKTESVDEFMLWLNKRYKNKLRHQKHPEEELKKEAQKPPKEAKNTSVESSEPPMKATPEECFEFYLVQFESSYKELIQNEPIRRSTEQNRKSKPKIQKKKKKKILKEAEDQTSLLEKWLNAFERSLDSNEMKDLF